MKNTGIQWATDTANPTSGCCGCELARPSMEKTDPSQLVCYAYQVHMNRLRHSLPNLYAQSFFDVRLIPGRIAQYARARDLRGVEKKDKPWFSKEYPRVIFLSDMADALSPDVPFEYLRDEIIRQVGFTPQGERHVWMWLTKQAKRLVEFYDWLADPANALYWPSNLWAGVSVTSNETLWRVDHLLSRPFHRTFVSYEPAWEWVDFFANRLARFPSLIIAGGESGRIKRPFDLRWPERLIEQGRNFGTSVFIKQLGAHAVGYNGSAQFKLKDSHGGEWSEWPDYLRVREFPTP